MLVIFVMQIKMLMANAPSVSITTDAASMHTGDSYVAVTAHWLDPQWNMMSCVLGVSMSNGKRLKIAIYNIVLYTQ